jgi:predicted AAA+ superfamily ATPase
LPHGNIYFYRTSNAAEVDFVIEHGTHRIAIECKASKSPRLFKGNMNAIEDIKPDIVLIACPVDKGWPYQPNTRVVNLSEMNHTLKQFGNQ